MDEINDRVNLINEIMSYFKRIKRRLEFAGFITISGTNSARANYETLRLALSLWKKNKDVIGEVVEKSLLRIPGTKIAEDLNVDYPGVRGIGRLLSVTEEDFNIARKTYENVHPIN